MKTTRGSTIMMWVAVVLLFGAYLFPLWRISLAAPQYPEGMGMKIWISKITGAKQHDLQNINGLNHYIGMRVINAESIPELRFMKYIVAFLIGAGALAATTRRRALFTTWVVIAIVASAIGMADFYKWEYDYGHNLNPDAPIKVPGMTYQPPFIGSKRMLNITATSYPGLGGIMCMLAVGLGVAALFLEWLRARPITVRGERTAKLAPVAALFVTVTLTLMSCSAKPVPIDFGEDECSYCKMTIADENYGGEIVTLKGKVRKYDSVECLVSALGRGDIDGSSIRYCLTIDFASPTVLIDAAQAVYLHSPSLRSPMGMGLTAFATEKDLRQTLVDHPGQLLTWDEARALVLDDPDRSEAAYE